MWRVVVLSIGVWAAGTGCLAKPADVDYDADLRDALPLDAAPACPPDSVVCADGVYVDCGSDGVAEVVVECPLGCSESGEACVDIAPSNGLATTLDDAREAPGMSFTGTSTIDTTSGEVCIAGQCSLPDSDLVGGIRAYPLSTLTIEGTLKVTGTYPVAFVVDGDIRITGALDVSADGSVSGPGARPDSAACTGKADVLAGGGGGGAFEAGALGGTNMAGDAGAGGEPSIGYEPLLGGCEGATVQVAQHRANGGGGGGAVQLVSRTKIEVLGAGVIDASGGGGRNVNTMNVVQSGGGGGSGGAILLEAPEIELNGPDVSVLTCGGGGAAPSRLLRNPYQQP